MERDKRLLTLDWGWEMCWQIGVVMLGSAMAASHRHPMGRFDLLFSRESDAQRTAVEKLPSCGHDRWRVD
ncbi:hypothetical protein BTVI_82212 [Pitangus sulphuratus]|nr:hypothetical protein BTVI_82212 [Pitangus sulphuratus]